MFGEGGGGGTDFCDGAKLRPGPKAESLVGDGGEVLPIYGLYRFSIYTLSDLGDLSNLIGSLSLPCLKILQRFLNCRVSS